ncbi:MAG: allose ABC transporter [Lachnospiraceae bacterium]|jgi:D-allose transport system permease protein|nr:allose ABC transporter [Lachnospiraceae bacterium]
MTRAKFKSFWDKFGTLSILILIMICLSIASPKYFMTPDNVKQIGLQSTVYILLAFGEFFAILLAGIDLSVGSVAALVGTFIAMMLKANVPVPAAILAGLLISLVLGAVNGVLINALDLHPFVVTLGTNTIFRGVTLVISKGSPIFGLPASFKGISGYVLGFPIPFIFALVMSAVLIWFTNQTVVARNLYALGGNKQAAWYSGINTRQFTLFAHMLASFLAGVAGVIMTSRVGAAEPTAGEGYETYAIASCIIGGTSFFGGKGKIFGVLLGGLTIGTITNGLNILNVSSYWQKVVMGTLIIASVALEKLVGSTVKD